MSDRVEFQRRAEACVRLAQTLVSSEQKAALLDIAELWRKLAERADERRAIVERARAEAAKEAQEDGNAEEEHQHWMTPLAP